MKFRTKIMKNDVNFTNFAIFHEKRWNTWWNPQISQNFSQKRWKITWISEKKWKNRWIFELINDKFYWYESEKILYFPISKVGVGVYLVNFSISKIFNFRRWVGVGGSVVIEGGVVGGGVVYSLIYRVLKKWARQ